MSAARIPAPSIVVVYNPYGALKSGTGVLTVNSLPNLSLSETDVSCNGGSDGQVAATFSNGTGVSGALQVNIDGGSYSTQTSPYSFTGLAPGSHTVTVQDVNGCTSNLTITVNQPTAVTFTTSQVNETCNGGTTGSITVTPSGGSGSGYTYSQDNGATFQAGNQFTGLAAGTYNIVVKDGNGCLSSSSAVTITQPNAVTSTSSQVNETCNGQSIGSITVTPSGGSGSGYTYSQDNGANFQAGNQFTGLGAATYQIVVKDGAGCVSSATGITISQPTAVSFNTSQVNEMCNGQSIGSITVTTSGGSGAGYTYSKDNGATFQAGNQFTGLAAGTYQIVVKDGAGCLSSATAVTITQPAVVTFTTSQVNETCNGQSIGSITVTASGGSGTYTYSKDNGATFQTGATFSSLAPGAYQIVVKDSNGCLSSSSSVTITEPTAISLSLGETDVSCNGGSNGTVTATFSGGTGTLQVNINGGAYSAQGSPYTFTGLSAGSNTVSVQDANGCTTSQSIMVNQPAAPPVTASSDAPFYGGAYQIVQGQTLHLSATTVANATSYNWSRDGGSTFVTGQNVSDVPPAGTHVYTVTVPTSCGTAVGSTPSIIVLTADGSGVPDQWKTEHGYSASTPSSTVGANGMTLLQSYLAGVDPNDPSSTFTIQSVSVTPAGVVTVQWNSTQDGTTPTRNYDVYATTNYFTGAGWSRIASYIAPQGASTFYSDATDNGVTLKFYRITIAGTTQAVTLNVAALQNLTLLEGRNYISMSSLPGTSTLLGVLGTNQLPQGAFEAQATVAEVWDQMNQNFGNMSAPNIYYLGTGSSGWKQDTTATPTNNALLDPNKGIIVTIRPGQGTQTVGLTGFVPTNNQIQTVQSNGYTVASSTFPNVVSLNANVGGDGSGLIGSGFTGGISLSHSDNLLFYNPTTQLFDVRVWYDTGSQLWRNTDASVATAQLQPGQSFLIQRRTRATNFTWTNSVPYTVPLQGP